MKVKYSRGTKWLMRLVLDDPFILKIIKEGKCVYG